MEKEALEEWIKARLHDIRNEASSVKPGFFPERLHEFRTETKKLRAMMRLVGIQLENEPQLPKPFRKLYRAAGAIRDRQMHLQYVASDKRHTLPFFAVWLAHKTGEAAKDWDHAYNGTILRDLENYLSGLTVPALSLQTLGHYLRDHQEKIAALVQTDPDDDALHEIRKLTKDMRYMVGFCEKNWPAARALVNPLERVLERLSNKAGAYNDRRNLLESLGHFQLEYAAELDEKSQKQVARAGEDWAASKTRERTSLLAAIRQLVRKKIEI